MYALHPLPMLCALYTPDDVCSMPLPHDVCSKFPMMCALYHPTMHALWAPAIDALCRSPYDMCSTLSPTMYAP